jgi:hypothetical protein
VKRLIIALLQDLSSFKHGQNGPKTLDMSQVRQAGGAITDAVSPVTLNTPEIQSLLSARLLPGKSPVLSSKSVRSTPTSTNRAGSSGLKNTAPVPSQGMVCSKHGYILLQESQYSSTPMGTLRAM